MRYRWIAAMDGTPRCIVTGGTAVGREHVARQRCLLQIQRGHPVARVVSGEVYMVRAIVDRLYLVQDDIIFPWLW